jgi:hypothetical protein
VLLTGARFFGSVTFAPGPVWAWAAQVREISRQRAATQKKEWRMIS